MITDYFNDTVEKIREVVGQDSYTGEKEYNLIAKDEDCRWLEKTKLIRSSDQTQVLSSVEVWLSPDLPRLKAGTEIIKDEENFEVLRVEPIQGLLGKKGWKVYLK